MAIREKDYFCIRCEIYLFDYELMMSPDNNGKIKYICPKCHCGNNLNDLKIVKKFKK